MKMKEDFNSVDVAWIVFATLAVIFIFWLTSCSPSHKLSRLKKKHPELFSTTRDTTIQEVTVVDNLNLNIHTDTTSFDSVLVRYVNTYNIDTIYLEREEISKIKVMQKALERELRKGVFVPTIGEYKKDGVSFSYSFNPALSDPLKIHNLKVTQTTIKETQTITLKETGWEKIKNSWYWVVIVIVLLCLIGLLASRR
jgi:hypothetical protein